MFCTSIFSCCLWPFIALPVLSFMSAMQIKLMFCCVFVTQAVDIYGRGFVVCNAHGLTLLSEDVKQFGSLGSDSVFPFENFLGQLKRLVCKPQFPLQQTVRRLFERTHQFFFVFFNIQPGSNPQKEHKNGPVPSGFSHVLQFEQIFFTGFFFFFLMVTTVCR